MRLARSMVVACAAVLTAPTACDDAPPDTDCGPLPDRTACPRARGGTCEDPACSAIFACTDGSWSLVAQCPARDAGAQPDGSDGSTDAASCDAAPAPSGACPPLQAPDCDVSLADACPVSACTTGCETFLRCEGSSWSDAYVAYCDDDFDADPHGLACVAHPT